MAREPSTSHPSAAKASKRTTARKRPAPRPAGADIRLLGSAGPAVCRLAITRTPWDLPIDSLVIPGGRDGVGRLGDALFAATDPEIFFEEERVTAASADEPAVARIRWSPAVPGRSVRWVILANAHEAGTTEAPAPATLDAAARATRACIGVAAAGRHAAMGLPLIGAGAAGLDRAAVADVVVAGVRNALRDLAADASLREVVFVAEDEESAVAIEAAWQGYRSQPFANDRPDGPDLLGIRDEVEALADMLLLRDVQPPLAVGVLGGWGSGKSFVMHLMRDRLKEIRAAALAEDECWEGDRLSPFVGHVYPIEFNAWTYARADLWAALMQTTLNELDRQLGLERRLVAARRDLRDGAEWRRLQELPEALHALYEQSSVPDNTEDLFASLNLVHAAERQELDKKQARLAELRAEEARAEREVEARVDTALAVPVDAARWAPFRALLADVVGTAAEDVQTWLAKEAPETTELRDGVAVTTQDARQVAVALRALRPPDRVVAKSVLRKHWLAATVFLVVSFAAPPALAWLHARLGELTVSAGFLAALAALTSALRVVRGWAAVGTRFADRLAEWQAAVAEDVHRIEATRDAQVDATKRADSALAKVRDEIARTSHDVELLRQRVGLVGEFRSVADLVKERLESGTYQQRLGVMQQISEDLASLSRSLTTTDRDVDRDPKRALFPRGPARVVLFIDDLDRCPPPKVVEVLEAVQLLLATNLFVVVAAIDVRYVTKALEKVYEGVLDAGSEPSGADYLEKIIQIPYRTRPLTTGAAHRFLSGQLRVATDAPSYDADDPDGAAGHLRTASGDDAPDTAAPRGTAAIARDLLFTRHELDLLARCCTVLAVSPRASKRVANVAKLFRMVWARRGMATPTLDETATLALLVAVAAAHPEVQRDALAHLSTVARDTAPADLTVTLALLSLPGPPPTAGPRRQEQHRSWRAAVEAAGEQQVFAEPALLGFRLGAAKVTDVARVLEFVSAFCFVADTSS